MYVDAKSVKRNEAGGPFSAALAGFKLRQRNAVAAVFEYHFHRHVDVDFIDWTADDVAAEARTVVQVDPCGDVGNVRREAAQRLADDFANDGEGKNFALAADLYPFEFVAGAIAANRPRAKDPCAAVLALLHHELAGFGAVPKRLVDRSNFRQWFFDFLLCHSKKPFVFRRVRVRWSVGRARITSTS